MKPIPSKARAVVIGGGVAGCSVAYHLVKQGWKDAVLAKMESGLENRMVQFKLLDPEPLVYHNEPIVRDGEIVGYVSSGNFGHSLGGAIAMGYVPCKGESAADVLASSYEVEIAGNRVTAEASLKPMYDPKSERVKA